MSEFTAAAARRRTPSISSLMSLHRAGGKSSLEMDGEVPEVWTVTAPPFSGFLGFFVISSDSRPSGEIEGQRPITRQLDSSLQLGKPAPVSRTPKYQAFCRLRARPARG